MPRDGHDAPPPNGFTLDELLAQGARSAPLSDLEREWLDAPAVGREFPANESTPRDPRRSFKANDLPEDIKSLTEEALNQPYEP